jgi:hypothetical protein
MVAGDHLWGKSGRNLILYLISLVLPPPSRQKSMFLWNVGAYLLHGVTTQNTEELLFIIIIMMKQKETEGT